MKTLQEKLRLSGQWHSVQNDDQTHLEYRLLIEVAYSRITRARDR